MTLVEHSGGDTVRFCPICGRELKYARTFNQGKSTETDYLDCWGRNLLGVIGRNWTTPHYTLKISDLEYKNFVTRFHSQTGEKLKPGNEKDSLLNRMKKGNNGNTSTDH